MSRIEGVEDAEAASIRKVVNVQAPPEIAWLVADCKPALVVVEPAFVKTLGARSDDQPTLIAGGPGDTFVAWRNAASAADPGLRPSSDDAVLQLYTSGTTGRPKGAVLTNTSLFGLRAAMAEREPAWYRWSDPS